MDHNCEGTCVPSCAACSKPVPSIELTKEVQRLLLLADKELVVQLKKKPAEELSKLGRHSPELCKRVTDIQNREVL